MMAVPEDKETMVAVTEEREKTKRRKNYRVKKESQCSIFRRRGPIRFGLEIICNEYSEPCTRLVTLYARLGLHRYNLLQGKNLQLSSVMKYNQSTHSSACPYDITLEAMNDLALLPFQTTVYETSYGKFAVWCSFARPLGETKRLSSSSSYKNFFLMDTMPEWPPEDPFEHSDRYYVVSS
ncbi:PREDICTED: uncharacterized protein At4g17700 [Camelina sativa]|uniref:Uncharacterized protein At4g17700 n=1 Tax=Camelina sativa TaxID=90675 RepID=A0ABM0VY69_CAMSA|nr:PREDICTED: uncharacterized protein At4g17700 [Camelina sativa]